MAPQVLGLIGCGPENECKRENRVTIVGRNFLSTPGTKSLHFEPAARRRHYDSANGCMAHDLSLTADDLTISVKANRTMSGGWRAIRNNDGWKTHDVHYQFRDNLLEFSLKGNNPTDIYFDYDFQVRALGHSGPGKQRTHLLGPTQRLCAPKLHRCSDQITRCDRRSVALLHG